MNIHKILFMANLFIIFIANFPSMQLQLNRMQCNWVAKRSRTRSVQNSFKL